MRNISILQKTELKKKKQKVIKMSVSIWEASTKEYCFNCQHYHKGFCYSKQISVEADSLCIFYMTNWKKVRCD